MPIHHRHVALTLIVPLVVVATVTATGLGASDLCSRISEGDISAAMGIAMKRSGTNPCQFQAPGARLPEYVTITTHAGAAAYFDDYVQRAGKEIGPTQAVSGIGSKAVFYEGNLAVKYKNDFFIVMIFGQMSKQAKLTAAKAIALRVIQHL